MTLQDLGFVNTGRCACAGRPIRWMHVRKLEVKQWDAGKWKLLNRGFLVRYGNQQASMIEEVKQYMDENNI